MWLLSKLFGKRKNPRLEYVDGVGYDTSTIHGAIAYEKACDESLNIHKLAARVKNHCTNEGAALTNNGVALCNTFTHHLLELHKFAFKIKDHKLRQEFVELLRRRETIPSQFIKAITPKR